MLEEMSQTAQGVLMQRLKSSSDFENYIFLFHKTKSWKTCELSWFIFSSQVYK